MHQQLIQTRLRHLACALFLVFTCGLPTANAQTAQPVIPFLDEVVVNPTTGLATAYFGYHNQNTKTSFQITQSVIANGGDKSTASSGNLTIEGTAGQPAAGTRLSNFPLSQTGGFWAESSISAPTAAPAVISGQVTTSEGLPLAGVLIMLNGAKQASTITNSKGAYHFEEVDTESLYTLTPLLVNYRFNPASLSFSLLGNKTDANFNAIADAIASANPLDTPEYFVRQQYLDLLGREPDPGGLRYWSDQLLACGNDAACSSARRSDVAAAFFVEQEFQQTGSYIYNLYSGALGRRPAFVEYIADRRQVIGGPNLDMEKAGFSERFVQRAECVQKYQSHQTAESFVDALLQSAQQFSGVDLGQEREGLLSSYSKQANQEQSRAAVVRTLADNSTFKQSQYNAAFVLTEYFAYLRRDPDPGGYTFWLNVLNDQDSGNYRGMVCSFITSTEYQRRFSSVVTHNNGECGH